MTATEVQTNPIVFTYRVAVDDALNWQISDNLGWALTDAAEQAAIEAGVITSETECTIFRRIENDQFVLEVVL